MDSAIEGCGVNCPNCGRSGEAGQKFCLECGSRLASGCPSCGTVNPAAARFCGECGAELRAQLASAGDQVRRQVQPPSDEVGAPAVAERRLVTILFADLVGFTTLAEGRDPEVVRDLLGRYFDVAREVVARHGGVVEKFIGDAVMALWGAPTAHEDDAERGVRAGLELVSAVQALEPGVQARVGVLTGEAAVSIGAVGQGLVAGDLVNTASRLQSVAAPGTVLVGEVTVRAASGAIAFEAVGEQALRGKVAPVPAFRAVRVIAERGGRGRGDRLEAPFAGRESELRLLKDLVHATSRERRIRLVSITGQAGIGKSRLAWEFQKYVDGVVDRVLWHEGRSPAYGDGITFWALGEMVRSRARLVETDDDETTRGKVREVVARHVPDAEEARRIEVALLALLGVGEPPAGGPEELFTAWRTWFERLAAEGTVALLFEDLHWADQGLLDFIDHLLDWSRNVPILIITLARPELLERRPGWGAGRRNFLALDLEPLTEPMMRELLAGLVPNLPEAATRSIVARAEGIPLYAVETVRMLVGDGRLREREGGGFEPVADLGELAVPETLHALIAARLDALDSADRALVQDAAVLGQSFTIQGLAAVANLDPETTAARLQPLVRAELFSMHTDARSPERGQYAFVQGLIREVAYSTLSLRSRRSRHLAAARYFESLGEDELAGALAAHYLAAWRSATEAPEADALAAQARLALRSAADRAMALGAPQQAMAFLEQALEVSRDETDRAETLEAAGDAAVAAAFADRAEAFFVRAQELRERAGDDRAVTELIARRGEAMASGRLRDQANALLEAAIPRYAHLDEDPAYIRLLATAARTAGLTGDDDRAFAYAERVLTFAERAGDRRLAAETMITKGAALIHRARMWEGRALLEGARKLAEDGSFDSIALRAAHLLAFEVALDDPRGAVEFQRRTVAIARRIGRRAMELSSLASVAEDARRTGEWDWILPELDAALTGPADALTLLPVRMARQLLRLHRGLLDEAELADIIQASERLEDQDVRAGIFDIAGSRAYVEGRWADAVVEWWRLAETSALNAPYVLPRIGHASVLAGDSDGARRALDRLADLGARGRAVDADRAAVTAGILALEGDRAQARARFATAMAGWQDLGLPWDEALTALLAASTLGVDEPEIAGWAATARATFGRLGAQPLLERLDEATRGGEPRLPDATAAETRAETPAARP